MISLLRTPLLVPSLLLALSVVSCGATLWKRPVDEVRAELVQGNHAFVLSKTTKELAEAPLSVLGDGAAWNLGSLFAAARKTTEAELLWRRSLVEEPSPWSEAAGRDLFALYSERRDWPKAEAVALKLAGFGAPAEYRRMLFEAYYFQRKDDQAWNILKSWKPGMFPPDQEQENQLFFGVLSARLGNSEDASRALVDLVFNRPASGLHFRLESFFQEDETRFDLLGPDGREAMALQGLLYRAVPRDIQAWFRGRTFAEGFWNHRAFIEGLEAVYKVDSRAEVGLRLVESIRGGLTGEAQFAAEYARGRLYRALGRWSQARAAFQAARALAVTVDDQKKTAWNWLNAWVRLDPQGALDPFVQVYSSSDDPGYYTDVFEDWLTGLVQDRRWDVLAAVVRELSPHLPAADRSTAGFILARLAAHGLVSLEREGITLTATELLQQSIETQPFSYEALVSRAVLGQALGWTTETRFRGDDAWRRQARLWDSMARLGQVKRMAAEVSAWVGPVDPEFVEKTAGFLQTQGQYRASLQILYRLLRDPGRGITKERAFLLYPKAYEPLVTAKAEAEGLDPSLLWGLMREESAFDPSASSWVGARGLTQLMPATAAETAQRMRIKDYDLNDPEDSITLGARYLATMIRSQERIYLALMAYNAGGGRIRPWKATMGKLPEEIFVEAAPFEETRGYVKRILTSTVMFGVLHHDRSVEEMVRLIYPNLLRSTSP